MKGLIKLAMRLYRGLLAPMLKWIATGNPRGALCRFHPPAPTTAKKPVPHVS